MKIIFFIVVTIVATALSTPTNDEIDIETLRQQRRLEIQETVSKRIEDLVRNIQDAAKRTTDAIDTFITKVNDETELIDKKIENDISRLRKRASKAITDVTDTLSNSGSDIIDCVIQHKDEASTLFNKTITKAVNCVEQRVADVNEQITDLSTLVNEAVDFANNTLEDMNKCTQENGGSFISIGSCLGSVAVRTEMKAVVFATQSTLTIGRISLSIATLPASLETCVGSRVVEVGITSAKIIMEIGSCSASSLLSSFIGAFSDNNQSLF